MGIQGLGGVGKSTLAAYFYHSLDFEAKFWADVSAKPDFTIFAEKIIIALGGKVAFPIDLTELINNLLNLLSQRRCLLVVDNLETLLDQQRNWQDENYQQFFSRWLQQGTKSTLLLTTQDKPSLFQSLQSWYPLGGMKITEGVELFHQLGIIATEEELTKFVEYVQGHPLTIKLVAGYLISYCDSQFSQVEELELAQFELAYQEATGSHRNQKDARLSWIIQQHLDKLSLEQTQFLIGLSVYRVPFNRQAASYMWHEEEAKPIIINKKLQELCDRSLLIKTEEFNFQFESLVQKFILQQAHDLSNAHVQAIEYYQANLKEAQSWQVLEDVKEYLEIIHHRCESRQYAIASNVLNICYEFLSLRGYYAVLVEVYEPITQGWQSCLQKEDRYDYAWALNRLGIFYRYLGKVQQSIVYNDRSLKIFQDIGSVSGSAAALNNLGIAYFSLGEYLRAIDFHRRALAIRQQIGDRHDEAASLNNLGNTYCSLGEYSRAIDFHQQSLTIQQQIGDRYGEGISLNNLGNAYLSLEEYPRAIDYLQQSLAITQQIGDRNSKAVSLNNLGIAYHSLREYSRAIDFHQKSLAIQQKIGNREQEAKSIGSLGNVYYSLREYSRAIDFHQKSLAIQQQIGDRYGEANSLGNLGNAYYSLGKYSRAIDFYQQLLAIAQKIGDRHEEANAWFNLFITYNKLQQESEAKAAYENYIRQGIL
ncbi:MAG: tetratricopeptide repeat protein [Cyanobacteria bacterium P01_G01_bin.39]